MAIFKFDTQDAVPEDLRDAAEEIKDGEDKGKWKVKVTSQKKLDTFRDNNVELAKKYDATTESFGGVRKALGIKDDEVIDQKYLEKMSTELADLRKTKKLVDDGKLTESEAVEKEVEKRTEKLRQTLEDARNAAVIARDKEKARADENDSRFKRTFIDRDVYQACSDADIGVNNWAGQYVLQEAYQLFVVEDDNKLVPKRDGSIVYGETGGEPMTIKEWINGELRKKKPEFFKVSGGGGATGSTGDLKQFGGLSKEEFNKLSPQRRLQIANEMALKNPGTRK